MKIFAMWLVVKTTNFFCSQPCFPIQPVLHKTYGKKNLTDKEILFNYRLFGKSFVTENVIGT